MPKLIKSNGLVLTVYDIGDPVYQLSVVDKQYALPAGIHDIMSDNDARDFLRKVKQQGSFESEDLTKPKGNQHENSSRVF